MAAAVAARPPSAPALRTPTGHQPAAAAASAAVCQRPASAPLRQPCSSPRHWACQRPGGRPSRTGTCHATATDRRPPPAGAYGRPRPSRPDIAIEPGPANSRCIWAGVDIGAPAQAVYAALTSYEALGTFIPGLAENRCLKRYPDGCRLLQVGQQDIAFGVRLKARVCLRIREHPAGMPPAMLSPRPAQPGHGYGSSGGRSGSEDGGMLGQWWPFKGASPFPGASSGSDSEGEGTAYDESRFLRPRSANHAQKSSVPPMDISFELQEGDFMAFKGLWRVQGTGAATCRLSYTLFVRPQPWLLAALIEQRVREEIVANLAAVKAYVEATVAAGMGPPPPSMPPPSQPMLR